MKKDEPTSMKKDEPTMKKDEPTSMKKDEPTSMKKDERKRGTGDPFMEEGLRGIAAMLFDRDSGLRGIAAMLFDRDSEKTEIEIDAVEPGHVVYIGIRPADADPHEYALRESIARSIEKELHEQHLDSSDASRLFGRILKLVREGE